MNHPTDATRMCLLTPTGRGAVAVVAVFGPAAEDVVGASFCAKNGKPLVGQPFERPVYGHWGSPSGEDLIVCRRSAVEVEVHCHGGSQSVASVLRRLRAQGCLELAWQDWLRERTGCYMVAEAHAALASARTLSTATILLDQSAGALRNEINATCEDLQAGRAFDALARIERLLDRSGLGLHLTRPWQIIVAGAPNVGKSSLINAIVGYQRAIVFDQPGTTRDVVSTTTVAEGWPLHLSDTAGLHQTQDELEAAGIEAAAIKLAQADLLIWVVDPSTLDASFACDCDDFLADRVAHMGLRLPELRLLVVNKSDLVNNPDRLPPGAIWTSALTGEGVERLLREIVNALIPVVPESGEAVPFTDRQVALLRSARDWCRTEDVAAAIRALRELTDPDARRASSC